MGYGLSRNSFPTRNDIQGLNYSTPSSGKALDFSLDYRLSENRYIGLGYAMHNAASTINTDVAIALDDNSPGIGILWQNYRLENETQFYDIHYKQSFLQHLDVSVGFFYFRRFSGDVTLEGQQFENIYFVVSDSKFRGDDMGLSLSIGYFFKLKDYLALGLQGRAFYSFSGLQSISFAPTLKVSF